MNIKTRRKEVELIFMPKYSLVLTIFSLILNIILISATYATPPHLFEEELLAWNQNELFEKEMVEAISQNYPENSHIQKAISLWSDKEYSESYITFLKSLDSLPMKKENPTSSFSDEKILYELDELYDSPRGSDFAKVNQSILDKSLQYLAANNYSPRVEYYLAIAYANLIETVPNACVRFYHHFYNAYSALPQYHLAYKAKSILYFQLFNYEADSTQKMLYRQKGTQLLTEAILLHPTCSSAYRTLLTYCSLEKRGHYILTYIPQILDNKVAISRSDVYFYVYQCALHNQLQLARQIVDYAKGFYRYSKNIEAAEELINQMMSGESAMRE